MGWSGVEWLEKSKIKLSQLSTKVEVEVEAELGNIGTPPFKVDKKSKLMKPAYVNISLSVTDIISIVEVNHEIELKFHILMEWFDQRLKFQNPKRKPFFKCFNCC